MKTKTIHIQAKAMSIDDIPVEHLFDVYAPSTEGPVELSQWLYRHTVSAFVLNSIDVTPNSDNWALRVFEVAGRSSYRPLSMGN